MGKCKPCKEQGFQIAPSAAHDGMSDFQSIWKVTLSLLLVSFERKTCSPFDNCLTFDSLLRPIRRCCFFWYIFMLAIWRNGNKEDKIKNSVVTFLKPFKGKLSAQLSTSDTTSAVLILSPFICCLFFLSFSGQTQSAGTSSLPAQLKKKMLSGVKKCQPPKGPAKSQLDYWKQLEGASHLIWKASSTLRDREPSPLHSAFLRIGSLLSPPFGALSLYLSL